MRENLPGDYEPLPLEQVLENMSELGYTLVSREQGGPEDDWRERCIWEDGQTETQTAFYWADSMADLESFWPGSGPSRLLAGRPVHLVPPWACPML